MPGKLILVGTPIGNLGDVTLRALEALRLADLIVCEDTRTTRKLLDRHGLQRPLLAYDEFKHESRFPRILERVRGGATVAVVSEAGMPCVSDPGSRLVEQAHRAGLTVDVRPGPSAVTAALALSGFSADRFVFEGFLPRRPGRRRRVLRELARLGRTMVFFESPHRLDRMLADCLDVLGERPAAVIREMTKVHQEVIRGTLSEVKNRVGPAPKGEIVVVISGTTGPSVPGPGAGP